MNDKFIRRTIVISFILLIFATGMATVVLAALDISFATQVGTAFVVEFVVAMFSST